MIGGNVYIILGAQDNAEKGTGNIGDGLIDKMCKDLVKEATGETQYRTICYLEDLSDKINELNKAKAVLIPTFTFWNGLKKENPIFKYIDKIKVPIIPLASNIIFFPGDYDNIQNYTLDWETKGCLKKIMRDIEYLSCREYMTQAILNNNGIKNTKMIGDCGWYDLQNINKPMKRPNDIQKLVFTVGHYRQIFDKQIEEVIKYIAKKFPNTEKIYSTHQKINCPLMAKYANLAKKSGFEVKETYGDPIHIEFYEECDLHIGYRVHGHLGFLRKRVPSILIAEDNRGVGFGYTFNNIGVFPAFDIKKTFAKTKRNEVEPSKKLIKQIDQFLNEELSNNFRRYTGISDIIDETFHNSMMTTLKNLPR